jgi:hypothetical protein
MGGRTVAESAPAATQTRTQLSRSGEHWRCLHVAAGGCRGRVPGRFGEVEGSSLAAPRSRPHGDQGGVTAVAGDHGDAAPRLAEMVSRGRAESRTLAA